MNKNISTQDSVFKTGRYRAFRLWQEKINFTKVEWKHVSLKV